MARAAHPLHIWLVGVVLAVAAGSRLPAQSLLDRVVARVNGTIVLLSDVRAAAALGLVTAPPDSEDAVEQMVQRELLLDEVGRFPPPEPSAAAIDAEVVQLRGRAGGSFERLERDTGLQDEQIRMLARNRLRVQAYVDQRFGVTVPLTDEQVLQYYRDHPDEFVSGGAVLPFEQAQSAVRDRAGLAQRQRTVAQWLTDLRARADVTVTASPAAPRP